MGETNSVANGSKLQTHTFRIAVCFPAAGRVLSPFPENLAHRAPSDSMFGEIPITQPSGSAPARGGAAIP